MLTDDQIERLASKMNVPLERVCFKDELSEEPLAFNKSYVINMEDSHDDENRPNKGTHWVCMQVNNHDGKIQGMYFDPYGQPPPVAVKMFVKKYVGGNIPYNKKDVQSLMANCCGYFCLAYLHYINEYAHRANDLFHDTHDFLDYFEDLDSSIDYKKNEFILRQFFMPKDEEERRKMPPIDLNNIMHDDENGAGIRVPAINVKI